MVEPRAVFLSGGPEPTVQVVMSNLVD